MHVFNNIFCIIISYCNSINKLEMNFEVSTNSSLKFVASIIVMLIRLLVEMLD